MNSPQQQRIKALRILLDRYSEKDYTPLDYYVDAHCRKVLQIPERPENALPYVGWMTDTSSAKSPTGKLSCSGLEFIKQWEGCRTNAYQCSAGVWTIGYGHTKGVTKGMMISHTQADKLFLQDVKEFEDVVDELVTVPLNQNQFDALVSFVFNVGKTAFKDSTLLRLLNTGNYKAASSQFNKWVYAGGVVIPGLVARREAEYQLFIKP